MSVRTYHIIMSGADIVKESEQVSSLGAHRFILFGVLHPPHQRFGVLFAFGVHFFKAGAVLGQGGHSLGAVRGDDADKALSLQLPRPLDSRVVPPCPGHYNMICTMPGGAAPRLQRGNATAAGVPDACPGHHCSPARWAWSG